MTPNPSDDSSEKNSVDCSSLNDEPMLSNESYNKNFHIDETGLLTFQPSSPLKPKNWSVKKKLIYTMSYSLVTFAAQLNSTTTSSVYFVKEMKHNYNIGREVSTLSISLYILGIAFGPMVFAPISEVYGRKIGVLIPFLISCMFTFATAISYNVPSLMICRFLAGVFSGAPVVSSGGVLADLWEPAYRGAALALYACVVANGAAVGPVISSLLINSNSSHQSWRIPQYFTGLLQGTMFTYVFFCTKETYEPVILQKIAKKEKIVSNKWEIHSEMDKWRINWGEIIRKHVYRPFKMLVTPIVFVMALFASYVFGILYLMITNISTAYEFEHGWYGTTGELPNFALFIGIIFGCIINMLWAFRYAKLVKANGGKAIPEQRFPIMIMFGWMMPAGIFIFGWTSSPNIHWIVPMVGIMLTGCGFISIFQGCLNYLVDLYPRYAASAIAANTFLRSVFAAVFPLFARQLFSNLGVHWGASLIAFFALGMIPIPVVLFVFAERVRNMSKDLYID